MSICAHFLFWIGCFLTVYSYAIYPLVLGVFARSRRQRAADEPASNPPISIIITARNEEKRLEEKLENTLAIEYPSPVTVLVASDCSTDATDDIVRSYAAKNVELVRSDDRKGKEYAQWLAIRAAKTPLLVFTDVATRLRPDALLLLAKDFTDPSVGAVSSEDELVSPDQSVRGEGAYVLYEMWLRRLESRNAGLVGLSGSCFAVRREVCERWRIDTPSDITVALLCSQLGKRAISNEQVKGTYEDLKDESREFARKKRTIIRGMTAVWELRESLNPFRNGAFALQVWSHKVFRWLVPIGMLLALAGNLLLARQSDFFKITLGLQALAYLGALAGQLLPFARKLTPIRILLYFVSVNIATAAAGWDFIRGVRITTWSPSQR